MKPYVIGVLALAILAACGVDGEPIRPTANLGVSITSGGVKPSTSIGVTTGNVSVGVGL